MRTSNGFLNRFVQTGLVVCGVLSAQAQNPTEFRWSGKGDGVSWSDAKNWKEGAVPTGSGSTWRPEAWIDVSGSEVTIDQKVPRVFGDIKVGAGGKGCTLNINGRGNLQMQGSLRIGVNGFGTFNMSGGKLEVGVWGSRDLIIGNGVMNFGSATADNAPEIKVTAAARGFGVGQDRGDEAEVTLSGYGSITTVERTAFSLYGSTELNVSGGNLKLAFDTKATGLNRIGGDHRNYKAVVNYKLDSSGASTLNFGGDVLFGVAEFNLALDPTFVANPGAVYTIISTDGNFTGRKGFANVENGQQISVGGYTFRADYVCDPNGKDQFILTVVSGNIVG